VLWLDMPTLNVDFNGLQDAFAALKLDTSVNRLENDVLVRFIDTFITCSSSGPCKDIVREVQTHVHTLSCKKYKTTCRFGFPRFPSDYTVIAQKLNKSRFENETKYEIEKNLRHFVCCSTGT
jgi:hypothetical protein